MIIFAVFQSGQYSGKTLQSDMRNGVDGTLEWVHPILRARYTRPS